MILLFIFSEIGSVKSKLNLPQSHKMLNFAVNYRRNAM